ncbi:unnamed protein product [Staurois parvus]|uniref:Uncharacterized protein n=1 Tax=Staurois parvus TaxID=386267 RepID=A0ABN9H9Z7_9NEOB|nr:unnamed protein product [Staurois parvus]
MSLFYIFKFPTVPSSVRPDVAGNGTQKTDAGIGQRTWPGTLQGGHWGRAQDKVSEEQIPEQRCKVFPSVARGYCLCYTREYLQGG